MSRLIQAIAPLALVAALRALFVGWRPNGAA